MNLDINLVDKFEKLLKNLYEKSKGIKELNIKNKELTDIVTDIDIFMENEIVDTIKKWFPTHSICAEEGNEINNISEYKWIIDPIMELLIL